MKIVFATFLLSLAALLTSHAATSATYAGAVPDPEPTPSAPIWGKLVITGNVVTCYYANGAATPSHWTQLGTPQTVGYVNNPLLVGIYITSLDPNALSTGTIDNVTITPATSYRLADVDIGAPSLMGSANLINGVWTISGCGTDIWNTSDQFNFQPWLVWGDCTIVCRVTSLSAGKAWQKIGIMIRDGYNSGSAYASFCATKLNGVCFQYRLADNNNPDQQMLVAPPTPGIAASNTIGYDHLGSNAYVLRP